MPIKNNHITFQEQNPLRHTKIFFLLCFFVVLLGNLFHIWAFSLNEILKVADSFAYLQMAYFLEHLSPAGLGSGWFGFVYSLPIAVFDFFLRDDFLAGKVVNILLLNISAFLLYKISRKVLSEYFSLLVVSLFFMSASFLDFSINILSENIYLPLFLGLFLATWNFLENISLSFLHTPDKTKLNSEVFLE